MADDDKSARRAELDKQREARQKAQVEQAAAQEKWKPTPTQAENDAFREGAMTVEDPKEPDGSPEETAEMVVEKVVRPAPLRPASEYQTKAGKGSTS